MKYEEAKKLADRFNVHSCLSATVVRILPESIDPIQDDDTGWDVETTYRADRDPAQGVLL